MNKDWRERFDEQFVKDNGGDIEPSFKDSNGDVGPVRVFIQELLKEERERTLELVREEINKKKQFIDLAELMCDMVYAEDISTIIESLKNERLL